MAQSGSFDITPEKEASKLQFLRRQFAKPPPAILKRDVDLSGKTAVLLELGLTKLILTVRDESKSEAARTAATAERLLQPGQTVEVWKLDYASYESVMAFAQRVDKLSPRVDIAVLNAGVNKGSFALNPTTKFEEDIQTNYLSTVLVCLYFLRSFQKAKETSSSPGRITIVSSDTAAWAKFAEKKEVPLLPAFNDEANFDVFDRYGTSKLLGQLFVTELAKHVSPALAVVNCTNPGLCHGSGLQRDLGTAAGLLTRAIGHTSAIGARGILYAAVKLGESSHGHYVEDGELRPMAPFVYSKEAQIVSDRLWKETMEELSFAGSQGIIESLGQA